MVRRMSETDFRRPAASVICDESTKLSSRPSSLWRFAAAPLLAACLSLGACNGSVNCAGGVYRSGCIPGPDSPTPAQPAMSTPAPMVSVPVSPAPVAPAPAANVTTNGRGDPNLFADVDDRQCRSYGLAFGSRDYADCRIRLSAQHRGLDPNLGAPAR